MELICDLSHGIGPVVHYVRRRLALGARDISAAEELDWFGNYLHEGLFFEGEDYAEYDGIQIGDFAAPINDYYEALHNTRLPRASKPSRTFLPTLAS